MEKCCRLCGETKPLSEFHRASTAKDGHRSECKACFRAQAAARYLADPERVKRRVRQWQRDNPDRVRATQAKYREDGRKQASDRRSYLKRTFSITPEEYDDLFAAQGGVCAICSRPPKSGRTLHVDHDHRSGRVRGLLCFGCNAGIGKLREDPDIFKAAVRYLMEHRLTALLINEAS